MREIVTLCRQRCFHLIIIFMIILILLNRINGFLYIYLCLATYLPVLYTNQYDE